MSVREKDNPALYTRIQEQNLLRQYDLLSNCVEIALEKGIESFEIHPFVEGNGRTARAACYYLICMKHGKLLPGKKIVPERIREDRAPYYAALRSADQAWDEGKLDVSQLAKYLEELLKGQLADK